MNIPRMKALADHLETLPRSRFDQNAWCGTACCIAGHAVILFGSERQRQAVLRDSQESLDGAVSDLATSLLGLSWLIAGELFDPASMWPPHYQTRTGNVTPKLAAKRLRRLIQAEEDGEDIA